MYNRSFVPALGDHRLSPLYDTTMSLLTCERTWQRAFVKQIDPLPRDVILDVGCGTGTLAILLKQACPAASIYGSDPDPDILTRAENKARDKDLLIHFSKGYAQETASVASAIRPNKIVTSLVLHQVPLSSKRSTLLSAYAALRAGGELHIADYGQQYSPLMRMAHRHVQAIDGFESPQPSADGMLPELLLETGFIAVQEHTVIPTPTGSISLYSAMRP
ncbi:MAG: class I SAM-dependent methyltransferase [Alphaproteobacteria bacterium]|nr:class I SAM-dependent methyltransferase [Alphaproteobacteria bacterium]